MMTVKDRGSVQIDAAPEVVDGSSAARCPDCSRILTNRRSIERGVGPRCWEKREIAELKSRQLSFDFGDDDQQYEQPPATV